MAFRTPAQNLSGQWKGTFSATGSGEQDEYVLELEISGKTQVSGYSYTYFNENGFRYFTICKISGYLVEKSKTITVTEVEKIKGNIPPGIMDCLQVHTLTYFKSDTAESLEGTWKPAPGFDGGCGSGTTTLSRKMLVHTRSRTKKPALATGKPAVAGAPLSGAGATADKPTPSSTTPKPGASKPITKSGAAIRNTPAPRRDSSHNSTPHKSTSQAPTLRMDTGHVAVHEGPAAPIARPPASNTVLIPLPPSVRQRTSEVQQTIDVNSPEIKIELYDDGVIDHDTVTVYFNGKTVVNKAMLKHQPIRATLTVLPDKDNDLILFADNLGDIPPNTALLVVIAGEDRYDIRVNSDEQKNGAIRFRLKKSKTP